MKIQNKRKKKSKKAKEKESSKVSSFYMFGLVPFTINFASATIQNIIKVDTSIINSK